MRDDQAEASALMAEFAARTGITSSAPSQRYLWTDAFAVINFLELHRRTGDPDPAALAAALIDDVHGTLGRHRADAGRTGWLSGLSEDEGQRHPTVGGLRIGKPLPEREADEPVDEQLEWNRDGQYFHYLTKWMDALSRSAVILGVPRYHRHAVELARTVIPRFLRTTPSGEPLGLIWKMSVDLSRPQVDGTNPHDALDGYATVSELSRHGDGIDLRACTAVLKTLSSGRRWGTADPLGIGGLLTDAFRLAALPDRTEFDERLTGAVLAGADLGLAQFLRSGALGAAASRRLAFRELGLAIGLQGLSASPAAAAARLADMAGPHLESLREQASVGSEIIDYWQAPENREVRTWTDHRDINEVMLSSALLRSVVAPATASS